MMRQIFNEIISKEKAKSTHQTWYRMRIKVLFKKGDVEDASNYPPICTLLTLYENFLDIALHQAVLKARDSCHPPDQGGYRRSHQTVDGLTDCLNNAVKSVESHCTYLPLTLPRPSTESNTCGSHWNMMARGK